MLQFISHYTDSISYIDSIRIALDGGCKWIQLRMKHASTEEIHPVALEAQRMCHEAGATFIIDDHVELAKEINADGVHLGKNDMPINEARSILGPTKIIGGTANTYDDVVNHVKNGADYIGCGPFRFTTTKENLSPILGLDGYRNIVEMMKRPTAEGGLGKIIPIVAIGGITINDIDDIMHTGVTGIALSSTILHSTTPIEETKKIIERIKATTQN